MSEEQSSFSSAEEQVEIIDSDMLPAFVPSRPTDSELLEDDYDGDDSAEY